MSAQPKALWLASVAIFDRGIGWQADATAELKRLHAVNADLMEALHTADRTFAENGLLACHAARKEIQAAIRRATGDEA